MNAVTPTDLQIYLGLTDFDTDRAQMLIDDAVDEALTIIGAPADATYADLPDRASRLIRSAAGRIYLNRAGATTVTTGPYAVTRPAPSGSMFSARETAKLRRAAGISGAFAINMLPADVAENISNMPWWDADPATSSSSSSSSS